MFQWVRRFFSSKATVDRVKIAEEMLLGAASIKIDQQIAESTAKLAEAFCKNSVPGVVDTGIFIFVKMPDDQGRFRIFAKRLSLEERIKLNEQPSLLDAPEKILESFSLQQFDTARFLAKELEEEGEDDLPDSL